MNEKNSIYNGGLYGCLKDELKDTLNDFESNEDLFVVSVKMTSGITVYSLPKILYKCRNTMTDLVNATDAGEMFFLGATWVNTAQIVTVRMCKYVPKCGVVYDE